jgi:thiol-disulfide isomerase/thioredoxin
MAQRTYSRSQVRMRRNSAPLIIILIGAGLLITALAILLVSGGGNEPNPNAILLLDGGTTEVADYQGQVLMVNFWASWCPPCRAEMPEIQAFYDQYQDAGLALLMVNSGEPEATARSFIQQTGFTFPVGLDPTNRISDNYGINALPVTLVYDRSGQIVYRHSGMISQAVLDAQVTPLLTDSSG